MLEDREIRALAAGDDEVGDLVVDHVSADRVGSLLPGELEAPLRFTHHARIDDVHRGFEEVGALHEEWAQLGEKDRKRTVDGELERVGLDL